jgi:hypothetical protein
MEKRRFPRLERQLLVSYDHFNLDNLKDDEGIARTLDMSIRGLLLELPRAVEVGSTLRLNINLEGEIVELFGEVVRLKPKEGGTYEVGVELRYVPERFIRVVESFFLKRKGEKSET